MLRGGREAVAAETAERPRAARTADGEGLQGSRDCPLALESASQDGEEKVVYVGHGPRRWRLGPTDLGCPCPVEPGRAAADAVALCAGWLGRLPALIDALEDLRGERLLCRCGPTEPRRADMLLAALAEQGTGGWCPFSEEQRVVAGLAAACHHNGADLRVDTKSEVLGNIFPRQEVDTGIWSWRTARQSV
ncbi:unnamed protein product [Prorocentrum cordatum]|uniref:Uncharacterized protein n=1 Tax=Prorocentrum cordatum TaxID=2364126 RepID=A0ABN9YAB6_9DINO|nr:unnamed protein product [Polarella glacialis]